MKLKLSILFSFFCLSSWAQEYIPKGKEAQVMKVLKLQECAWNNANLDSFMLFYWNSPDLRFVSKNGVKKGWQPVYDGYKKNYAEKGQMGKLSFVISSIELVSNDNAMVIGSWKVENSTGVHEGYFTLWFKKIKGNWLIVVDHTS
ncbi:MAG: DUF4440 domain-containing protein [Bacteroidetes bacterium B1(2017)]|nr:MAG: DUF4440 domain-containing protein [Bacteroidetes bacterium B1(2017)]